MDLGLEGRHALVAGASGNIGAAVMEALAGEGAYVLGASRDVAAVTRAGERLGNRFVGSVELDLANEQSVASCLSVCESLVPSIDLLVCCAARSHFSDVWRCERTDWEQDVATKLIGTADLARQVASLMMGAGGGAMVILTGIASQVVMSANPAGGAANAALENYVRLLASEAGPSGVRVVGVSPGMIQSARLTAFAGREEARITSGIPLRRLGEVREIARAVTFLGSPAASYISGTTVIIDGGLVSGNWRSGAQNEDRGHGSSGGVE